MKLGYQVCYLLEIKWVLFQYLMKILLPILNFCFFAFALLFVSEYSSPMNLKSQMKSTPKVPYNEDPEVRAVRRQDLEPINNEDSGDYTELLASKIFRLTEEELKESNWVSKNVVEYERFEEICVEFEGLILDVLLNQAIDDFVKLSYEALCAKKA